MLKKYKKHYFQYCHKYIRYIEITNVHLYLDLFLYRYNLIFLINNL